MVSTDDLRVALAIVAVLALIFERLCGSSAASRSRRRRLFTPSRRSGMVHLYVPQRASGWAVCPDIASVALESALQLLGVEYEVTRVPATAGCFGFGRRYPQTPFAEMDGQQLFGYDQVVNAVCHRHPDLPCADDFQRTGREMWREQAACSMVLGSLSAALRRVVWRDDVNRASVLAGLLEGCPRLLRPLYAYAIAKANYARIYNAGTAPAGGRESAEALRAAVRRDMTALECLLRSLSLKQDSPWLDGRRPGWHDCLVYAAAKCMLDSPLPSPAVSWEQFPHCRTFVLSFDSVLESLCAYDEEDSDDGWLHVEEWEAGTWNH